MQEIRRRRDDCDSWEIHQYQSISTVNWFVGFCPSRASNDISYTQHDDPSMSLEIRWIRTKPRFQGDECWETKDARVENTRRALSRALENRENFWKMRLASLLCQSKMFLDISKGFGRTGDEHPQWLAQQKGRGHMDPVTIWISWNPMKYHKVPWSTMKRWNTPLNHLTL